MSGPLGSSQWMYTSGADFTIPYSCRFDNGDSANLTWTPASASNRKTFTISFWTKLTGQGGFWISAQPSASATPFWVINQINDNSGRKLRVNSANSGDDIMLLPNGELRDYSSWYHIVVACDTTQNTDTDRLKIYINGVQETSFATETYPAQHY